MRPIPRLSLLALALAFPCGAAATGVAASPPSLSLAITFKDSTAVCHLRGHGFYPHERVRITYTVRTAVGAVSQHTFATALYRRTVTTDSHGSFTRSALYVTVDTRNPSLGVQVRVTGARGDHALYAVGGDS